MSGTLLHTGFDALAWAVAGLSFIWLTRPAGVRFPPSRSHDLPYIAALVFGAGIGAFAFGSMNLWLSQQVGLARSIEVLSRLAKICERQKVPIRCAHGHSPDVSDATGRLITSILGAIEQWHTEDERIAVTDLMAGAAGYLGMIEEHLCQ